MIKKLFELKFSLFINIFKSELINEKIIIIDL